MTRDNDFDFWWLWDIFILNGLYFISLFQYQDMAHYAKIQSMKKAKFLNADKLNQNII